MSDDYSDATVLRQLAERFHIDVSNVVDEGLLDRILHEPVHALTPRMQTVLLQALADARKRGHTYVGAEHVLLTILRDPWTIPSQALTEAGLRDQVITLLDGLLSGDSYNRAANRAKSG